MNAFFVRNLLMVICIMFLFSCETKRKNIDTSGNITPKVTKNIIVYGSKDCEHCIDFRNKMDSAHIKYEFKDAEAEEKYYNELFLKIQQANFKGYVAFPVVEINDKIYVRPEFSEFLKILDE